MIAKYSIRIPESGSTVGYLNIPIDMSFQMVDQYDDIKRDFVDIEVEKAINPILDYEKVRFIPALTANTNTGVSVSKVRNVKYDVRLKTSHLGTLISGFPNIPTSYGDIGISSDDIRFGKMRYKMSFLRLDFYDNDKATDQRLISNLLLFPKLMPTDINLDFTATTAPNLPKPASEIKLIYILSDPILDPSGFAEGFHLYNYKDDVNINLPKALYMRASFNNAATGKITNLMVEGQPYYINELVNKIYTKYILIRDKTGYYYTVDTSYPNGLTNNVTITDTTMTIMLYEIQTPST